MYSALNQNTTNGLSIAVIALLLLFTTVSHALPGDREQPIHITADQALRDEKSGFTSYQGNVVMSQGSLRIEADKVTVYHDTKNVDKIIAVGTPAMLEQQPDAKKSPVKARANTIEYYKSQNRVQLLNNARIQQEGSTVTGNTIDYYMSEERVTAESDRGRADSRVEVVIPPQATPDSSRPAAPKTDTAKENAGGANGSPDRQ